MSDRIHNNAQGRTRAGVENTMETNGRHRKGCASKHQARRATAAAIAWLLLMSTGCMLSPRDGDRVPSRDSAVHFGGYTISPGAQIEIEGYNTATSGFETTGIAVTASSEPFRFDGSDFFSWSTNGVIPRRFWVAGRSGYSVRLRARLAGSRYSHFTFRQDLFECFAEHPDLSFVMHCPSEDSPILELYTANWIPR